MADVRWTKSYDVKVDTRHFRIHLSEHEGQGFHASCLWYDKARVMKAPGQPGALLFHLEQRHASTADQALQEIQEWLISKFGKSAKIEGL